MRVGLISDTHGILRPAVFDAFAGVDLILHAGDVGSVDILVELETIAPVHAVLGNTDPAELRWRTSETRDLELEGHTLLLLHGHQLSTVTPLALHAAYPGRDVIVYGHTHRQRVDDVGGCLIVNPGAAGAARFDLKPSVALLTLQPGRTPAVEHNTLA
ncbi:metallophosphoesterase family protein [soil metagenome]